MQKTPAGRKEKSIRMINPLRVPAKLIGSDKPIARGVVPFKADGVQDEMDRKENVNNSFTYSFLNKWIVCVNCNHVLSAFHISHSQKASQNRDSLQKCMSPCVFRATRCLLILERRQTRSLLTTTGDSTCVKQLYRPRHQTVSL